MRPKMLTMCGWGPYRNKAEVDFTGFEQKGIFLITGATGAGKTTIFDAITYALYGALSGTERDKERSSVRSDFADAQTPTYVELVMEHGGQQYRIRRNPEYFRPKKRGKGNESLTREKENAVLTFPDGRVLQGNREVNAALQELLVLDYQQFKKISMIAQGEFARLLVAPPKEKTGIFREIFGTGVYEKFTQGLGARSRQLYARVSMQKHKLEEDIRLLTLGLEKSEWPREIREKLLELTAGENWNYEEIWVCLERMEEEAGQNCRQIKKEYEKAEREIEKQTAAISRQEEENRRIGQFQQVLLAKERLEAALPRQQEKEKRFNQAMNAALAEASEEKSRQAAGRLFQKKEEIRQQREDCISCKKEAGLLKPYMDRADRIRSLLEKSGAKAQLEAEKRELSKQFENQSLQLSEGQKEYLEKETECAAYKTEYEEADRKRKLGAIGLAAELLEEGKPCPVCGSTSHPSPARAEQDAVSEEELERLKRQVQTAQEALDELHERLIAIKTRRENTFLLMQEKEEQGNRIGELLSGETDVICQEYLSMDPAKAQLLLQEKCGRARELEGLLQEKTRSVERLCAQEKELQQEKQEAQKAFEDNLSLHGFADETQYRRAKLSGEERNRLQKEIQEYQKQTAANQELYLHLKAELKNARELDLTEPKQQLDGLRKRKAELLKRQKLWETYLSEVAKTRRLIREKRQSMEEDSKEYGYVKDLENLASGNNAKRLVFEQYVLANYFEEILRAANLRFQKMTSGRYEMSRAEQVGDGRVKDNLEIQVMDYYTGKYRSVRTLSGGETFKASLCLALGMSDVIQAMNGGIRVDTLFVDEGFGALDSESLDQACSALMSLAGKNCLIGIISHVPELRERIGQQLVIDKTGSGSFIRISV